MDGRTTVHGLAVDDNLLALINHEALPGTGLETDAFWTGFAQIINDLNMQMVVLQQDGTG